MQAGRREGLLSSWSRSDDGGFGFQDPSALGLTEADANAYRADVSLGVGDLFAGAPGRVNLYGQKLGGGYSTASLTALTDTTQYGGILRIPLTHGLHSGREGRPAEPDRWAPDAGWRARPRLPAHRPVEPRRRRPKRAPPGRLPDRSRSRKRRAAAPTPTMQLGYDSQARWRSYGFVQGTLAKSGDHGRQRARRNRRRVSHHRSLPGRCGRFLVASSGPAGKLGTSYQATDTRAST